MSRLLVEFAIRAYIAAAVVGVTAPVLGCFLVQRGLSLVGDGMGHLAFAGVALGVLIGFGTSVLSVQAILGALILMVIGGAALVALRARGRMAGDVSLALVFYFGIAFGSVALSAAGKFNASAIGILFGSIFTTTWAEVLLIAGLCAVVLAVVAVFYEQFLAVALDEEMARASGLPVDRLNILQIMLVALLVAAGMRVVGLLLIAALFVIPVAAGSRLAHSFRGAMVWAVIAGVVSALAGLVIALGQGTLAPGGTIVLTALGVFVVAALIGRRVARHHVRSG